MLSLLTRPHFTPMRVYKCSAHVESPEPRTLMFIARRRFLIRIQACERTEPRHFGLPSHVLWSRRVTSELAFDDLCLFSAILSFHTNFHGLSKAVTTTVCTVFSEPFSSKWRQTCRKCVVELATAQALSRFIRLTLRSPKMADSELPNRSLIDMSVVNVAPCLWISSQKKA